MVLNRLAGVEVRQSFGWWCMLENTSDCKRLKKDSRVAAWQGSFFGMWPVFLLLEWREPFQVSKSSEYRILLWWIGLPIL